MNIPCYVPVLTLNSLWSLKELLPVLTEHFEDVFIIDGNSTDGTQEFARSLGVRVERQFETDEPNQRITHFARARLHSWQLAKHDWIFWIDADEVPTTEQIRKIAGIVAANETHELHRFIRLARLPDGRIVRHALFYPEYVPRLFHRAARVTLVDRPVHEKFIVPTNVRVVDHAETFIANWQSPAVMWKRQRRYISMDTESAPASWGGLVRWVYIYNLRSLFGQTYRACAAAIRGILRHETYLPWAYTGYFLLYRLIVMVESTEAWLAKRREY